MNLLKYFKLIFSSKKSYKLFPKSKYITVSHDLTFGKYSSIKIPDKSIELKIERNVTFNEFCCILIFKNGKLSIGKNVFFNNYCSINCLCQISIGHDTLFGEGVKIYDHNHSYEREPLIQVFSDRYTYGAVNIGNNCWIGSNVTILKGVTIGDNVIIGANCLIHKSIQSNSVIKASTKAN